MQHAVITGATRGIGRAICLQLAATANYRLSICARSEDELGKLGQLLKTEYGTSVNTFAADLSLQQQVKRFAEAVLAQHHPPGVLVNNVGAFEADTLLNGSGDDLLERLMQLNLYAPYHLTRLLLPGMAKRRNGHIININSIAALQNLPGMAAYTISKHALAGFGKVLRQEARPYGIRVTDIYPGAVYTSAWEGAQVQPENMIQAKDVAQVVLDCLRQTRQTLVEEVILTPLNLQP